MIAARVKHGLFECVHGVTQELNKGSTSPYSILKGKLAPLYHTRKVTVHSPWVRSPVTGEAAPVHHTRFYLLAVRKDLNVKLPNRISLDEGDEPLVRNAAEVFTVCEKYHMVMLMNDQCNCEETKCRTGAGPMRSGLANTVKTRTYEKESDSEKGLEPKRKRKKMAAGGFPEGVYDYYEGYFPTCTAAGGCRWGQALFNGLARAVIPSNLEVATAYRLRHLPRAFLEPNSEAGLAAIGNSVLQPEADAWAMLIAELECPGSTLDANHEDGTGLCSEELTGM